MKNILILGATSAIAEKFAHRYTQQGNKFLLVARNAERLNNIADDLRVRGAVEVVTEAVDLSVINAHKTFIQNVSKKLGSIDIVLIAYGSLGDQTACEANVDETLQELNTNCLSVISLLTLLANVMQEQKSGSIAVISSVAGDRGRQSNYVYGTAKGALSIFMQGLRNRLSRHGVQVLTIKPGFVDTPMTKEFKKGLLWASPESIAAGIEKAINKNKDTVYLPFFWRYIMLIIRLIPEKIFKRMSL
ncbi:MAG: SDR family oxidoreductase [Gammaproteobacteria bacterium]|nr:SDR family oxidoreductase [Gammaproteobacteria bacterium]